MAGVYGVGTKLCVADSLPTSPKHLDFSSESLRLSRGFVDTNGFKGTRTRMAARSRLSVKRVGGSITLTPTPVELAYLLPKILGAAAVSTTYALAETLPTFDCWVKRGSGSLDLFKYAGCGVTRATFVGRAGQALELTLDIIAQTETQADASTYPAGAIDTTTAPFVFEDLLFYLAALGEKKITDFTLVVDNAIDAERFLNSATLVSVQPTDRTITWTVNVPYGDTPTAYQPQLDSTGAGVASVATFTNGTVSCQFTSTYVQYAAASPTVNGRGEVVTPLVGVARGTTTANDELSVTLDSTP